MESWEFLSCSLLFAGRRETLARVISNSHTMKAGRERAAAAERLARGHDAGPRAGDWREVASHYIRKLTSTLRSTGVGTPSRIVGSYFLSETALSAA